MIQKLEKHQSLAEKAYKIVEEMIVTLELPPGSAFSEAELSERIGIGRTPLREALQRLINDGLVSAMPRRGMVVTEINIVQHLALLETRRVLDRLLSTRAARRATPEQRECLKACAAAMEQATKVGDISKFMHLDRQFDEILEAAARNPFAARADAPLHAHCRRFWYFYQNNGDLRQAADSHTALMNAVANGNEQAAITASDKLLDYLELFTRSALDA